MSEIHPKTYRTKLEVRGYELDSFGHVNHAVYVSYLEQARWKLLQEEGITLKSFQDWQRWPVISGLEVSYLRPTFAGDVLEISTRVLEHGRTNFLVEQIVEKDGIAVLKAKVRVVTVNESGRPDLLPAEIDRIWT